MIALAASFLITALLYAAVGFGGGSTYNALLVLVEVDYRILPSIALLCNLIVVTGGSYHFIRAGHVNLQRIYPWLITSIPAAWIGGRMDISETFFIGLLGLSLLIAGTRMLLINYIKISTTAKYSSPFIPPIIGALLGLLAGLVGIGGGIFLAPILHLIHWDKAKTIAGTCSIFILVNSLAGLIGQSMKLSSDGQILDHINIYWLLFPAVLIGGQIGSRLGATRLSPSIIQKVTALLILYVSARLLWRWWITII